MSITRSRHRRFAGQADDEAFPTIFLNAELGLDVGQNASMVHTRATSAYFVNSSGLLESAAIDVLRQNYDPANLAAGRAFLVERVASVQGELQTEDMSAAAWTLSGTPLVSTNTTAAPDGQTTADTVEDDDPTQFEGFLGTVVTVGNNETRSISRFILKDAVPKTTRFCLLRCAWFGGTNSSIDVTLDTSTGETNSFITSGSATIVSSGAKDHGSYWRLWITSTNDASGNTGLRSNYFPAAGANANLQTLSATAVGSNVTWGGNNVEGLLSSYIKSTTAPTLRSADAFSAPGLAAKISALGGTHFLKWRDAHDGTGTMLSVHTNATDDSFDLSDEGDLDIVDGGVSQMSQAGTGVIDGTFNKTLFVAELNNGKLFNNGSQDGADDTVLVMPAAPDDIVFGDNRAGTDPRNFEFSEYQYFAPRVFTTAEAIAKTT